MYFVDSANRPFLPTVASMDQFHGLHSNETNDLFSRHKLRTLCPLIFVLSDICHVY